MKDNNIDAVKMIREIRDKSSAKYFSNKKKWLKDLSDLQSVRISKEQKSETKNSENSAA